MKAGFTLDIDQCAKAWQVIQLHATPAPAPPLPAPAPAPAPPLPAPAPAPATPSPPLLEWYTISQFQQLPNTIATSNRRLWEVCSACSLLFGWSSH